MGYGGDEGSPLLCDAFVENVDSCTYIFYVALFGISCNKSLGISMFKSPFLFVFDTSAVVMREITQAGVRVTLKDGY